ncbi:hypothetical protein K1W69_17430 [Hoeflea sp. WL0058]|uniref:ArsR family transcriptional regulator n=1 Tax=Flavimaribacter sediminis TaxID=2865987 RepID=A0AAE2ZQP2_9HYPH|nr:hypothetical protein [Flavimaribacter sediminis]MBW8638982.1 hypothetical protein [Flavimaribacter sediminis]
MNLGIDYAKKIREDARLIILRALAEQINDTLASNVLQDEVLPVFGVRQDRAWVHQQLDYLANLGAISVVTAGTVKVATLMATGKKHIDRLVALEGVTRPSLAGEA